MKLLPPHYLLLSVFLMGLMNFLCPFYRFDSNYLVVCGLLLVFTGPVLTLWGARLFVKAETPIRPFTETTKLVLTGPYRFTRNPMYVGMTTILLGQVLAMGSLSPLLVVFLFVFIIQNLFIKKEEQILIEKFGEEYLKFQTQVPRWLF